MSIAFFLRFKDDGTLTVEPKQKAQSPTHHKASNSRKPFINKKEWEELEEDDEECMYSVEDC